MALSNEQIERYSRQIIVAKVGGVGQERLLASRILIAGEISDIEPVLAYLAGAGVGTIALSVVQDATPDSRKRVAEQCASLIARMHDSNPDVTVTLAPEIALGSEATVKMDLMLTLAGSEAALADERARYRRPSQAPLVFARLATDAKIAVFLKHPPCPVCADASLLAPFVRRSDHANFIALIAAVEAFKLLVGHEPTGEARIITFDNYATVTGNLSGSGDRRACACGAVAPARSMTGERDG